MRAFLMAAAATAALGLAPAAAPGIQFSATFDSIKLHARPGEVMTRTYHLQLAPGQPAVRFRAHVQDWWQSLDGKQSFYRPPGTLAHSCGTWVTLDPAETVVAAGGELQVRVTATIPAQARPGGYWCVLTVDEVPDPRDGAAGVEVRFLSSISTGIFVDLDPVLRDVRISGVKIGRRQAALTLRNAGNSPVAVEGRIEVFRAGGGEPVAAGTFARTTILTEPVASRLLAADLPDLGVLPPGRYRLQVVVDLGLDHDIGAQRELRIPDDLEDPSPLR